MVVIPAGRAVLGSRQGEFGRDDRNEADPHEVKISRPFAIGRYAVTAGEWKACVADGGCGSRTPGNMGFEGDRRPVIFVSWNDAQSFVDWLNKNKADRPYRLPSEAEWEFATRGCVQQECESEAVLVRRDHAGKRGLRSEIRLRRQPESLSAAADRTGRLGGAEPVRPLQHARQCPPMDAGLLESLAPFSPRDAAPLLTGDCSERVTRGGSWNEKPSKLRAGARAWAVADDRAGNIGFRVVREMAP